MATIRLILADLRPNFASACRWQLGSSASVRFKDTKSKWFFFFFLVLRAVVDCRAAGHLFSNRHNATDDICTRAMQYLPTYIVPTSRGAFNCAHSRRESDIPSIGFIRSYLLAYYHRSSFPPQSSAVFQHLRVTLTRAKRQARHTVAMCGWCGRTVAVRCKHAPISEWW